INTGEVQSFRYQVNTADYSLEVWSGLDVPAAGANDQAQAVSMSNQFTPPDATATLVKHLPEGIVFRAGETAVDSRSALAMGQAGGVTGDASLPDPVLFYPDGTTSSAQVILCNEHNTAIAISLRGLTGTCLVSEAAPWEDRR